MAIIKICSFHFHFYFSLSLVFIVLYLYYRNRTNVRIGTTKYGQPIKTAIGFVDIKIVEKNVFLPNGYTFIGFHQKIIPKIKEVDKSTCNQVFRNWLNITQTMLYTGNSNLVYSLRNNFTLNDYATTSSCRMNDDTFNNDPAYVDQDFLAERWSCRKIEDEIALLKMQNFSNVLHYKDSMAIYYATKKHNIAGKMGAVIGSIMPWVEIMCLANGANNIVTVDYQIIEIGHPDIRFLQAIELAKGEVYYDMFDFVVSFSSIEHSGLGRYGDPIDPIGDIREMQKVHCILKPGGLFFLGVPVGQDDVGNNCHRTYGRLRLPFMFADFELLDVFYTGEQPFDLKVEHLEDNHNDNPFNTVHFVFVLKKV